jgi:hypothetical protein
MARRRKEKQEETIDLSKRVFPYEQNFSAAFPKLSGGTIEYSQTGPRGMFSYPHAGHYEYLHKSSLQLEFPIIQCDQRPVCRRGGFELWDKIHSLMAERKAQGEFELTCPGFTGRLRPNTAQACRNTLRCRITLEYKMSGSHL